MSKLLKMMKSGDIKKAVVRDDAEHGYYAYDYRGETIEITRRGEHGGKVFMFKNHLGTYEGKEHGIDFRHIDEEKTLLINNRNNKTSW